MTRALPALLACALAAVAPRSAHAAAPEPVRRIAVVVGANAAAPGRRPLRYAHQDAARVAEVLRLAGFARADVAVLRDPDPDAILAALDRALRRASGHPSMVVFYYSGHADARALYPDGKELRLAALRERLDSALATVRIGIIDACRGGGWTGTKGLTETEPFEVDLPMRLASEGSVLISSSSGIEDAHESELLRGSFFTHHWNAALRGAGDRDGDGTVTLGEAFAYARQLTVRDTAMRTDSPQHPSFQVNLRGKSDLALVRLGDTASLVTVEQRVGPLQLVHLGTGVVVLELPPGRRHLRLALPPGRYLARRDSDAGVRAREIDVVAGRATALDEEDLELIGNERLAVKGDEPSGDLFFALGLGGGGLGGTDREDFSQGFAYMFQVGQRVTPSVHLLLSGDYVAFTRYSPDPDQAQQQGAVTLGARWAPFARVYGKAGLGVGHLIRQSYDGFNPFDQTSGRWGPAATAGLGWIMSDFGQAQLAVEVADSIALYDGTARNSYGVNLVLQFE